MRIPHYYLAGTRNSPVPCLHDSGCRIARGGVFDAYIHSPSSVTSSCSSSSCHTLTWRYLLLHYHTATLLFPSSCFLTSIAIVDDNLLPRKDNPYILFSWSPPASLRQPRLRPFIHLLNIFAHSTTVPHSFFPKSNIEDWRLDSRSFPGLRRFLESWLARSTTTTTITTKRPYQCFFLYDWKDKGERDHKSEEE